MIVLMLVGLTICYLFMAGMVVYGNLRRLANVLFGMISLCFAVWSLGMVMFIGGENQSVMRLGAMLFYIAATWFAPLLVVFALKYPCEKRVDWRWIIVPIMTTAIVSGLIVGYPQFIINTINFTSTGETTIEVNKLGYLMFSLPFVAYFLAAVGVDLWQRSHLKNPKLRSRQMYYMIGIIVTSIPGFIFDLLLPYFGDYRWIWIGPIASTMFLGATLYSMMRFRMLRVKAFLVRTVTYVCLILTLAMLYGLAFFVLSQLLFSPSSRPSTDSFTLNVILALLAAFIFNPLKRLFDRYAERLFYHRSYDAQQVVDELTKLTVRSTDVDTLLKSYLHAFYDIFHPQYVAVVFRDYRRQTQIVGRRMAAWLDYDAISKIDAGTAAISRGVSEIINLHASSQEIGYLVIGESKDDREYREKDVALFGVLASELSIALLNIFRLEEIRNFAGTLEREVNDATVRLRRSNEQLRSLDATKDEFVGMASHQLRTPLTSVKGYLSMVLEGDAGEITKAQRQLLQEAFDSSERMVRLIGDFLNVSRLQTGKFNIDRSQVDLAQLVAEEATNISQVASAHKVRVKFRKPSRFPLLYLDENKIRQVLMNLIDNAIYYSPESDSVKVALSIEEGDAVLRVVDSGIGVPKEVQKRLFTKFFRAENARQQRPDGTGIGLYLAKKIVDGHGGRLMFESEDGKGSMFGFRLPIAALKNPPKDDA